MATVNIGGALYEAFGDVVEANVYLAGDVMRAASWAALTDEAKARGLVSATRLMQTLPWVGDAPTTLAAPEAVKEVSFMLAHDLATNPELFADASGSSNVKSVKAGSASVEFFRPVEGGPLIPTALWRLLQTAGFVASDLDGRETVEGALVTGISGGCRPYYGRPSWDYPIAAEDHL
jgi:hypothetical protein